jgi:hypothetical protein
MAARTAGKYAPVLRHLFKMARRCRHEQPHSRRPAGYFAEAGLSQVEVLDANEYYKKGEPNFLSKIGIWSSVAQSTQMVEEGYITDDDRLKAIDDYNKWIESDAQLMVMKLKEVRGI